MSNMTINVVCEKNTSQITIVKVCGYLIIFFLRKHSVMHRTFIRPMSYLIVAINLRKLQWKMV